MRRILLLLVLASTLLTGSITQLYHQKVYEDGRSDMSEGLDLSFMAIFLPAGALDAMGAACLMAPELGCSVDAGEKTILIAIKLSEDDHYYDFSANYGLPYVEYTLTVNKIPNDRFSDALAGVMGEAGLGVPDSAAPIDLRDSAQAAALASTMEMLQIDMEYTVEMPGEIFHAQSGDVKAEIKGNAATFDMKEALRQSAPLTVRSRQVNWMIIILAIAAVAILLVGASFFAKRKAARPEQAEKKKRKK